MNCTKQYNHSAEKMKLIFQKMNDMRKLQSLCDVNVNIGERIFAVHKIVLSSNSEFFDKMFTGCFIESRKNKIVLNEIDPNAFETIIDCMYSSSITITEQNVQDILVASKFLLLNEIQEECIKFMKVNINVENCLKFNYFAHLNNEEGLEELCLSFLIHNFTKIKDSSDFVLLTVDQVIKIIKIDY